MPEVNVSLSQAAYRDLLEIVEGCLQSQLPDSEGVTGDSLIELAEREGTAWAISTGRNAAAALLPDEVFEQLSEPEEDAAEIESLANLYRELLAVKGGAA
jgi:hypothetical protein